jgi:peptidoglycan/xylan/chitin deacetylase (PgdA/CDA1 family)
LSIPDDHHPGCETQDSMTTLAIRVLRRAIRKVIDPFIHRVIILLYHRVGELPTDPQLLTVTRDHFAEHLEVLRRYGQLMSLRQLAARAVKRGLPRRGLVITFDDGYADNLYAAKPLLQRHDSPATVFVTSGYVGEQYEFWWDDLERLVLQPRTLPERLNFKINGTNFQWELGDGAVWDDKTFRSNASWNVLRKDDPTPRQALYRRLCQLVRPLPETQRRQVLAELAQCTSSGLAARPSHRTLTTEEVVRLAEGGLVEIGAHTVNHPVLSELSETEQRKEIKDSKARLEEILGHAVSSFAYPFGGRPDYTVESVSAAKEAGFDCACANFSGAVQSNTDRFQLPRILIRDWDGEEFARRLWTAFRYA